MKVNDGEAVTIGVRNIKIGAGDHHAGRMKADRDRLYLFALRQIHNGHSAGESEGILSVDNNRRAVGIVRKVFARSRTPAFIAYVSILPMNDHTVRNVAHRNLS